jgi:hypothetical protein
MLPVIHALAGLNRTRFVVTFAVAEAEYEGSSASVALTVTEFTAPAAEALES